MFSFIHSGDLHLGKRFGSLPEELRGRLREARHGAILRLAAAAREAGASTILLAGDTFDTETPAPDIRRQALAAMGHQAPLRWVILPGNHDSLQAEPLWAALRAEAPPNVVLAAEAAPLVLAPGVALLPAPCTVRRPGRDLTAWTEAAPTPEDDPPPGLAHGAIQSFTEDGAAEDIIPPDRARRSGLDYLALGDWHGSIAVDPRTRYSGTPEPDRFKHDRPGTALAVSIAGPGAPPDVREVATASFAWTTQALHLLPADDGAARLASLLPPGAERRQTLLRIAAAGRVNLAARAALEAAIAEAAPEFALLALEAADLSTECEATDLDAIDRAGALRRAAEALLAESSDPTLGATEREVARGALVRLFSLGRGARLVRIAALRLHNVRRFAQRGVAIEGMSAGVNVLCAPNEEGKSTSFEALHALFFQLHTTKAKDVQRLKPYSGGNPVVEADIETGAGRFRLRKQFLGGARASVHDLANGRLVAQADEAENFIKALVGGDASGPAGLLWVRQGITALDEPGRKDDGERALRESLLGSVQGEVEAVTGGRRMSEILATCEEELSALVTEKGRPKAGGLYVAAIEERDRLREREAALAADVATLRGALDARAKLRRDLARLDSEDEKAARRAALARAELAHEAAKTHAGLLATAEAEAALAKDRHADAAARLAAYRDDIAKAEACRGDLLSAVRRRDDAVARRDEVRAAIDRFRAEGAAAEADERDARDLLGRLDAAMAAMAAAKELDGLRARLAEAERLRAEAEERRAALVLVQLPADAVDRLQRLEIDLAGLRAAEEAGLPAFRIDYQNADTPRVRSGDGTLEAGRDYPVRDVARLDLPGIGLLTLRSNRPPDANAALAAAEARRAALLAKLGVADISDARRRQATSREIEIEIAGLEMELRHLAPDGLARLREEIASRDHLPARREEPEGDPDKARTVLAEAGARMRAARSAERATEPRLNEAHDAVVAADTDVRTLEAEARRLDDRLGDVAGREAHERRLVEVEHGTRRTFDESDAKAASLRAAAPDLASAAGALARARSVEEAALREASRLNADLVGLDTSIRHHANDAVEEVWRETQEALASAEARVLAFAQEVAILTRLRAALQAARSEARDLYLAPVLRELKPLLGLLFEGAEIVFDEKTLLPRTITRAGQDEDIDRLSGGMREQLSVLTRLAFARLLASDGRPAPVILDDALVYSDDDRIEKMFDALHRQAGGHQIIVFSCRQRAFSMLGGTTLRMIPWEPGAA